METSKYVFFYGHHQTASGHHVFSQWTACSFSDEDQNTYTSTEQYMMAQKALLFDDQDYFDLIIKSNNPAQIKKYGRMIRGFNERKWNRHKFNIVVQGNYLKFTQNVQFKHILMLTGSKTIVEASPYDRIWGIGLDAKTASKVPESSWPGENLLGKALVEVRKLIAEDENKK
jgi:ribA/ribD-fused uncharacterized protein